jgi:hypothetical protein
MRLRLNAFFEITSRWQLSQAERRALLGLPTDEQWFHFIRESLPSVTDAEFARVQAIIQLDEALSMCISNPNRAARWLHTLQADPPFLGRSPLSLLFSSTEDFKSVADYLNARRAREQASVSV